MNKNYTVIKKDGYSLTNYRALCRRSTMWIGQTCNQRCKFCYYAKILDNKEHPQNGFMSLEKIKTMCKALVEKYNNNSIDIEGGEPTIYKNVIQMIEYCHEIGLKPTLITNALVLDNIEKLKKYKEAGLYDFLISVHALGKTYDEVVCVPGASKRQMKAIDNMIELGIPFRFNTVLSADVLPQLMDVAKLAVEKGARSTNFIAYNPFADQKEERTTQIPVYTEIMKTLTPAIDYLEENEIEVNLRYVPFCVVEERHRKNIQNFQQRIWDLHEWESAGEVWTAALEQRSVGDELSHPPDFYTSMNNWRKDFKGNWDHLVEKVKEKISNENEKVSIALFGNLATNKKIIEALEKSKLENNYKILAYVSSKDYIKSDIIEGYLWREPQWLIENTPDLIFVTTDTFKTEIFNQLDSLGLTNISFSAFEHSKNDNNQYIRDFDYCDEVGEIEGFSDLEYAYKEHRLLCSKVNPYFKGEACSVCSISAICDGFHDDYAKIIGFDEAKAIKEDKKIVDPRYYMVDQLKVVEDQDADWALPKN